MRFRQLDEILEFVPREKIRATISLAGEEYYLQDHFPLFPVMPGVLMLESMFQAAMWLLRVSDNFDRPLITLEEVRNAKFGDFLQPGQKMEIVAEILKWEGDLVSVKAQGLKEGSNGVSARLQLRLRSIAEEDSEMGAWKDYSRSLIMKQWDSLNSGTRGNRQTPV